MSVLRLEDGRMYEMRESASEMWDFVSNLSPEAWVHLRVRQPGRRRARYLGLTLRVGTVASIEDDGLGYAREGQS